MFFLLIAASFIMRGAAPRGNTFEKLDLASLMFIGMWYAVGYVPLYPILCTYVSFTLL